MSCDENDVVILIFWEFLLYNEINDYKKNVQFEW